MTRDLMKATTILGLLLSLASSTNAQQCGFVPLRPPDPTVEEDFACTSPGNDYVWNDGSGSGNVTGRVYWPTDCAGTAPPGTHPLVLLMHGDGHHYTNYGYLLQHLARNGFIAASISNSGSNSNRAAQALTYLNFLRNHWTHNAHVQNSIGLIGHSRGGEAVLTVARRIKELALSHNVNAIISLAPTDNAEGGGIHEDLTGSRSEAFLVLYGTHDNDVVGHCVQGNVLGCGDPLSEPKRTGFSLFDRAGIEGGTEPFPLVDSVVTRSLLFIQGANHNSWRSTCAGFPLFGELSCAAHQNIARGYMNAFLRWRLYGESVYKNFFTGRWMPETVADAGVQIQTSYVEGAGRRVVDNFEQAPWSTNSLGGSVTTSGAITIVKEGTTWNYDSTSAHDTKSLVITWSPPGFVPFLHWNIPNGQTPFGARYRDITGFDFLSFRAGQVYGSSFNTPGVPKDLAVQLTDSGGSVSPWIQVSNFAALPYPVEANVTKAGVHLVTTLSAMRTVRIPLCEITGIDKQNVTRISFRFSTSGSSTGELFLDNLEFTD